MGAAAGRVPQDRGADVTPLATLAARTGFPSLAGWLADPKVATSLQTALRPAFARVGACETPNACTGPADDRAATLRTWAERWLATALAEEAAQGYGPERGAMRALQGQAPPVVRVEAASSGSIRRWIITVAVPWLPERIKDRMRRAALQAGTDVRVDFEVPSNDPIRIEAGADRSKSDRPTLPLVGSEWVLMEAGIYRRPVRVVGYVNAPPGTPDNEIDPGAIGKAPVVRFEDVAGRHRGKHDRLFASVFATDAIPATDSRVTATQVQTEWDTSRGMWTPGPMPTTPDAAHSALIGMLNAYRDVNRRPTDLAPMKRRLVDLARKIDLDDEKAYGTVEILSAWLPAERASEILAERERERRTNPAGFHPTAMQRGNTSAPLRHLLGRYDIAGLEVLDFGSGRGLDAAAVGAMPFDPYHPAVEVRQLPSGQFDLVLAIYVLNVLPWADRKQVLDTIRKKVRPGGLLYVAVRPEQEIAALTESWATHSDGYQTGEGEQVRFQRGYTRESLLRELDRHGAWRLVPLPSLPGAVVVLVQRLPSGGVPLINPRRPSPSLFTPAAAPTPIYFASGSNHPGEIAGFAELGQPVGVSADRCGSSCMETLFRLSFSGLPVFVDSGAFSEVEFPDEGPPVVVAPISDEEWRRRLALYRTLALGFGERLYVVAPDRVGDQAETLARLRRYAPQMQVIAGLGANVIVPLQRGPLSLAAFHRAAAEALGMAEADTIPGIPSKKRATDAEALVAWLKAARPTRLHLLGLGRDSPRASAVLDAIQRFAPGAQVSMDSVLIRAHVGATGGDRGGARAFTRASHEVRDELAERRFDDDDGLPGYTDTVAFLDVWATRAELARIAEAAGLGRDERLAFISDPSAWLASPVHEEEPDGARWYDVPQVAAAVDAGWARYRKRAEGEEAKRRAVVRTRW